MSRPIVLGVAAILLFAFGVIAANTRIVQGVIPVTAYEADVNKDAHVNVADLGLVASKYGQAVPTATPAVAPPTIVGNRAWGRLLGAPVTQLLDISNGTVVASYPGWNLPDAQSCDGSLALLNSPADGDEFQVVNSLTGAVLLTESLPLHSNPIFPCPLKGAGATFNAGHPESDRLIVRHDVPCAFYGCPNGVSGNYFLVRIYDLTNGTVLFDHGGPTEGGDNLVRWLTCSQDAVAISNASGYMLVRLSDGSVTNYAYLVQPGC